MGDLKTNGVTVHADCAEVLRELVYQRGRLRTFSELSLLQQMYQAIKQIGDRPLGSGRRISETFEFNEICGNLVKLVSSRDDASQRRINIFVATLSGATVRLTVALDCTIAAVKEDVAMKLGHEDPRSMSLIANGVILADHHYVDECRIDEADSLTLVFNKLDDGVDDDQPDSLTLPCSHVPIDRSSLKTMC